MLLTNREPPKIIWRPIPGSSQEIALDSRANHTLYTGSRGPGKSDTQLMRFKKNVGKGYGPFWRGIIFDREYKNLDDLVIKSKRWFPAFEDGAKFKESPKDFKWVWPTGEELLFRAAKEIKDYWDYHGQEFTFIGFNELAKYPTGELYEAMKSVNRSSYMPEKDGWVGGIMTKDFDVPVGPDGVIPDPIPLEFFSTANPWGAGHAWVKKYFIVKVPYGVMSITKTNAFNPQTQKREDIELSTVAIFGTYRENIYLDPVYVANLEKITDKNQRKAWLAGSWDIVAGGAIDDVWDQDKHIIPRFEVPASWKVDRAMDWGSSKPYSIGWFAESDGTKVVMPDGSEVIFPKGTIIQIDEEYGSDEIGLNKGNKLGSKAVSSIIKRKEAYLKGEFGGRMWVKGQIFPGPADNSIRDIVDMDEETIETNMGNAGVFWEKSNKSKGSRKIGLQLARDRLEAAKFNSGPGFYITENCKATIEILPTLPRNEKDPDDIDTEAEDHVWDMIRYRLLAGVRQLVGHVKVGHARG